MSTSPLRALFLAIHELADNPDAVRRVAAEALRDAAYLEVAAPVAPRRARAEWTPEERRAYERDRKARQRAAGAVPVSVPVVPVEAGTTVPVVPGVARVSLSDSLENLETSEREKISTGDAGARPVPVPVPVPVPGDTEAGTREEPASGTRPVAELSSGVPGVAVRNDPGPGVVSPAPDLRPIDPALKLSPEARSSAEMAGVRDVDDVWVAFVAHMVSTGRRSADFERGEWPKWYVNAKKFAARDAARGAARDPSTPEAPAAVAARRRAQDDAQARRDREDEKHRREAVPASVGAIGLMAAISKRNTEEKKAG